MVVWRFLYKYIKQAKYITIGLFLMLTVETVLSRCHNWLLAQMIGALGSVPKAEIVGVLTKYIILFVLAVVLLTVSFATILHRKQSAQVPEHT